MAFRIRRGTNTDRLSITPDEGELLYTTDTENVYIGDGSTVGGNLLTTSLINDTSPELSANLDLGGNNIVGTGNINIDGTITATGNINLGDGAEDNVIVGGQIQSSLIPTADGVYDIGTSASAWRQGFFEGINADGNITASSITVTNIYAQDSSQIINADTATGFLNLKGNVVAQDDSLVINFDTKSGDFNNLTVNGVLDAAQIIGDLSGSVFGDDSSIIIDAQNDTILAGNFIPTNNIAVVRSNNEGVVEQSIESLEDNSILRLAHRNDSADLMNVSESFGQIFFEKIDTNGKAITAFVRGGPTYITLGAGVDFEDANLLDNRLLLLEGRLGVGTAPLSGSKLEVAGDTIVNGNLDAESITASLFADDSTVIIDSTENTVTTTHTFTDLLNLSITNTEPTTVVNGTVAIADGIGWDPMSTGIQTIVVYLNDAWQNLL